MKLVVSNLSDEPGAENLELKVLHESIRHPERDDVEVLELIVNPAGENESGVGSYDVRITSIIGLVFEGTIMVGSLP